MTFDKSCTIPPIPAGGKDFVNFAYVGSAADGADPSLDRTKEGYVEIIEMATYTTNSTVGVAATHVSGVPPCTTGPLTVQAASQGNDPQGGLFGGMTLINVDAGTDYTEDAVAIDNFSTIPQFFAAGSIIPNLNNAHTGFNGGLRVCDQRGAGQQRRVPVGMGSGCLYAVRADALRSMRSARCSCMTRC